MYEQLYFGVSRGDGRSCCRDASLQSSSLEMQMKMDSAKLGFAAERWVFVALVRDENTESEDMGSIRRTINGSEVV